MSCVQFSEITIRDNGSNVVVSLWGTSALKKMKVGNTIAVQDASCVFSRHHGSNTLRNSYAVNVLVSVCCRNLEM